MTERGNDSPLNPEAVGQDPPTRSGRETAVGGWFKVGALVWIVVILVAVAFAVAIIIAFR
jgi:hypothetical protein